LTAIEKISVSFVTIVVRPCIPHHYQSTDLDHHQRSFYPPLEHQNFSNFDATVCIKVCCSSITIAAMCARAVGEWELVKR